MVLTRIASNYVSKRNAENTPPTKNASSFIKRKTSTASKRRRDRFNGTVQRNKRRRLDEGMHRRMHYASSTNTASSSSTSLDRLVAPAQSHWDVSEAMEEDVDADPSTVVWMPRHLPRPVGREIDLETLKAIDSGLGDVPLQYIVDGLTLSGPSMLEVLASTTVVGFEGSGPSNGLPKNVQVNVTNPCADLPTHMLAIYTKPDNNIPSSSKQTLQFVPAHSLLLAVHCANLPSLPPRPSPSLKPDSTQKPARLSLPVVPLGLPCPSMYARLSAYLYNKRSEELLSALVPLPPDSLTNLLHHTPPNGTHQAQQQYKRICASIAVKLSCSSTTERIMQYLTNVTGLWKNACALGVYDPKLWGVMEFAWNILTMAFGMRPGIAQVE